MGGLLVKSGLVEKLKIRLGSDLQQNEEQKKKAYRLLGFLHYHLSCVKEKDLEEFEEKGRNLLSEKTEEDVEEKKEK